MAPGRIRLELIRIQPIVPALISSPDQVVSIPNLGHPVEFLADV